MGQDGDGIAGPATTGLRGSVRGIDVASLPEENPSPVLRLAATGILLYANPAAADLLRNWQGRIGAVVPEPWRAATTSALAAGEPRELEVADGERIWRFSVVPIPAAGHVNFYGGEVTARVRAEKALRQALADQQRLSVELETIFATLTDGVLIYNPEMRVVRCNRAFLTDYGFDPLGLHGREIVSLVFCRELDGQPMRFDELPTPKTLRGEKVVGRQFIITRPDGVERIVETSSAPLELEGAVAGSVTVWHDITSSKQVEATLLGMNQELEARVLVRTGEATRANDRLRLEMAELARAQAALAVSEARYRALVENTPDWIWEVDAQGIYTYASPAVGRLLGYEPVEVLGKSCCDFMAPAEAERVRGEFAAQVAAGGAIVGLVNVNLHRDGHEVILETTGIPFYDDNGRLLGYRGVDRDITERRRIADQIIQAKNEWQTTFDAIAAPIMLLGTDYRIIRANRAMAGALGREPGEIVGCLCHELVHGSETPHCDCPHAQLLADGRRHQGEIREERLGGWFQVSVDPLYGADGALVGSIHFCQDINARIESAEALRCNAARLEEAQRLAHLGHWELDLRRDRLLVSDEVRRIYNLEAGESPVTPADMLAMVHPEEREAVARAYAEAVRNHSDYESQHRLLLQNGLVKHVHERCITRYDAEGEATLSLGTVQDITRQTTLEGQLRQAQKMEAIGTLAGGIAHDFNNILTAILGYGEIVLASLAPDSVLREDQEQVILAGNRAKELVKQILTFSRAGEQERKPLAVQFIIKEALKLLRASLPTTITIRGNIDTGCGPVLADPGQIHQVVMNLCTNAYHAMRETGGILSVSLTTVKLSPAEAAGRDHLAPGRYALLEVSDTGCGMEQAVRERIFDPYYTTKGKGEGTGLGLAVVRGIVKHLHGEVSVVSEPGQGASFKVLLPLIRTEPHDAPPVAPEPLPRGEERVLVVDDDARISRLEREILAGLGYRVTALVDSAMALSLLAEDPRAFDILLTDMTMPRLTGAELAQAVLRLRPEMPIILCTGYSELIDAEKAKAMGIREFLLKPVDKAELARAMRRALAGPGSDEGR